MLKISILDWGLEVPVEIVENDRGNWKLMPYVGETGCIHFLGFGGENIITVHFMPMQDGSGSVTVVHSTCDNPLRVEQGSMARPAGGLQDCDKHMSDLINYLIEQVCDYPEEL